MKITLTAKLFNILLAQGLIYGDQDGTYSDHNGKKLIVVWLKESEFEELA